MGLDGTTKIIGVVGAILTTLSMLPQAIKIIKIKETRDISLLTFSMFATGLGCWFIYGILIGDLPLIIANGVSLPINLTILFLKIKYK